MDKFIKDKVRVTCEKLKELSHRTVYEIESMKYKPCGYKGPQEMPVPDGTWGDFKRFDRVQGKDKHFWFYTEVKTPSVNEGEQLMFTLTTGHEGTWDATNPQGLLYLNGEIVQGLDINHRSAPLKPDTEYKILLYFYTGMIESHTDVLADITAVDERIKSLYYDLQVPYDAAMCFDEKDYTFIRTMKHLEQACNRIDFRNVKIAEFYESIENAEKYLKDEYFGKECGNSDAVVSYIGHTHIDVAWLWTLDQTREKVQRTFSTVLNLMDRYPEYVFMSSQPQLYQYLKEEEPKLYERVKEKVKEGRWEVEGAMWLEADCNLSSGESLIRQIMYGKAFMKNEFDVDSNILWLPDVFGYSAALPQILKKSGVDKFVTSKISWNESNKLPYDEFMWEGLDGTEIFTYFLTAQNHSQYLQDECFTTYVGTVSPQMNLGTWERFQQKDYGNETIVTYGYGDGGGGPTEEMIETEKRLEYGLPGMPKAQMSFAGDFLDRAEESFKKNCEISGRAPKWVGELYLEFHRGTYTSIAKNKKNNRECEFLCQGAETLAAADKLLLGGEYPDGTFHKSWTTILLNQFHDIIPGSSIFEVYEESDKEYAKVREDVGGVKKNSLEHLAANTAEKGIFVYNPNSFESSDYVEIDGKTVYAENIPAMGWKVIEEPAAEAVQVTDKKIESPHYSIVFDDKMNIVSIFDKDNERECVKEGESANKLCVFEDYPRQYDNWEITNYYKQKMWNVDNVSEVKPINGSGFGGFEIKRRYMSSEITQQIIVYAKSRRIDVKNSIDWHEHHVILKAVFPTNIHSDKASYEVQFGNVERSTHKNTSWDCAKFEVCAQKWADLSEDNYGISILNNCKYGYSTLGSEMTLTLIKCGTHPNPEADQGLHSFTYSIYPHSGSFKIGGTINEAYKLNRPMEALYTDGRGKLSGEYSLVSCDSDNIIIETVKQAESGNGIVIRLYDAWNRKSTPTIKLGFDAKKISLCNMLEEPIKELGSGNTVKVGTGNFEIITLLAEL